MRKKANPADGKPALELVEEAVQLLRGAPGAVHLFYYIGSIPFVLALLYFWSDMARGAYAYERIAGSSLQLTFLFLWMKSWQTVSLTILRAHLSASEPPRWTAGRIWRLVATQAVLQPTALFVRPVAQLMIIPYPWVRAYYENAMIFGDGAESTRDASSKALRQASLWKKQNVFMVLWLFLFGFLIWLNIFVVMGFLPEILRMFTGVETRFSKIDISLLRFNTTFIAVTVAFTYLCVNPITKAAYVLRCFYGESLHSGEDLVIGMRRAAKAAMAAAALLLLVLFVPATLHADSPAAAPAQAQPAEQPGHVKPGDLDDTISRVLKRDIYSWRLPRQPEPGKSGNFLVRYLEDAAQSLSKMITRMENWLSRLHHTRDEDESISRESKGGSLFGTGFEGFLHTLLWVVCIAVVLLLAWLIWDNRRGFKRRPRLKAQEAPVIPDLNSEDVMASQLPEDEWLKMARDLMERGELRLAIRALFLAMLAHLSLRELISIARHKSNRDYQRELRRRAGARGDLLDLFGGSVSIFEEAWYGAHAVTDETVGQFSANIERIKLA